MKNCSQAGKCVLLLVVVCLGAAIGFKSNLAADNGNGNEAAVDRAIVDETTARTTLVMKYLERLNAGDTNTVISSLVTELDSGIVRLATRNQPSYVKSIAIAATEFRRTNTWLKKYMTGESYGIREAADQIVEKSRSAKPQ